jgi:glycine cleavage system H protein
VAPLRIAVGGFELALDRHYDRQTNLWVQRQPGGGGRRAVRVGFDPLGCATAGDLVAVSFCPAGTALRRGEAFGTIEAAKLVGPLAAPVAGTLIRHNQAVAEDPTLVAQAPLEHWLVELELDPGVDLSSEPGLVAEPDAVQAWFAEAVRRAREDGRLAEPA